MFKLHFGYHPDSLTGSGVPLIQLSEMAPQYVLAIALQIIYTHYTQYVLTYPEPACCPAVSDSFKKVWGSEKKKVTGIISERVWCFKVLASTENVGRYNWGPVRESRGEGHKMEALRTLVDSLNRTEPNSERTSGQGSGVRENSWRRVRKRLLMRDAGQTTQRQQRRSYVSSWNSCLRCQTELRGTRRRPGNCRRRSTQAREGSKY